MVGISGFLYFDFYFHFFWFIIGFFQRHVKHCTHEHGNHAPVHPHQQGDDDPDGAINDGIPSHMVYIVGKYQGKKHPHTHGKDGSRQDIPHLLYF